MKKIILPKEIFARSIGGFYIEPTKILLKLSNNIAEIPKDMFHLVYIKLVGKLKHRSNWRQLQRIAETNTSLYDTYFRKYGKENDRKVIYSFFTMTDKHIFVPSQLKAKALIICYVSVNAMKAYNLKPKNYVTTNRKNTQHI